MTFLRTMRRLLMLALIASTGVALILVYLLPNLAPEDLPWTPLDLDAPVGRATAGKIAQLQGAACRTLLNEAGIAHRALPVRQQNMCGFDDGIALEKRRGAALYAPDEPPLACPVAAALVLWERRVVQPAAEQHFRTRVTRIDHFGTYACRRMYGRNTGNWSEHSRARAIDIAGFVLSDGRRITVAADWNRDGPSGQFLHDVRDGACRIFATTLSPDYNAAHRDHFHLDEARRGGLWTACH